MGEKQKIELHIQSRIQSYRISFSMTYLAIEIDFLSNTVSGPIISQMNKYIHSNIIYI
jgi:hypothetical protein